MYILTVTKDWLDYQGPCFTLTYESYMTASKTMRDFLYQGYDVIITKEEEVDDEKGTSL